MSIKNNIFGQVIVTGLFTWAFMQSEPIFVSGDIQFWPAAFGFFSFIFILQMVKTSLLSLASYLEWLSAYKPTGKDGTSRWAKQGDLKAELNKKPSGPFWGALAQQESQPLFIDFVSNAICVAPAGSGKGITTVITNIYFIRESKFIPDFKGELACICAEFLRKRGEKVYILNPGNIWGERLGASDQYNVLDIVVDNFYIENGLENIPGDLSEISAQIYPMPEGGETDNSYFTYGSRDLIEFAIVVLVIIEGYDATMASVAMTLKNRSRLEHYARWVSGVDLNGKPLADGPMPLAQSSWVENHDPEMLHEFSVYVRANASNIVAMLKIADNKTFESFLSGAQQRVSAYAFGPLGKSMKRSSFSMRDLKGDQPVTVFIVADSARMEIFKNYLGFIQWSAFTSLKRHKNTKRPVYAILDEATNYKINELPSLLTWGRGYGIRCLLVFQNFHAFDATYGKNGLEILISESEIKYFLPGQRSPSTLEAIVKMLGNQSVMTASISRDGDQGWRESTSESPRALMTADEVSRSDYGLLFVRKNYPTLVKPISYAEIHPLRDKAEINPMHGKPFKKKIKLRVR